MSFLGRLRRWLGLGSDDGSDGDHGGAGDASVPDRRPTSDDRAATGDASTRGRNGADAAGERAATPPTIPRAEGETGSERADEGSVTDGATGTERFALQCAVCGTGAKSGADACPLCGSADLRPADAAGTTRSPSAELPDGVAPTDLAAADDAAALVEEAAENAPPVDGRGVGADGSDRRDSDGDAGAMAVETDNGGDDRVDDGDRTADGDAATDDAHATDDGGGRADEPSAAPETSFSGPGPTETRSETADDDAVARLRELRERTVDEE